MEIDAAKVIERRRHERQALIDQAQELAEGLDPGLGVLAVVVFGSVARGDFNVWSDIDVLVVAEHLPERVLDHAEALGPLPSRVQVVAWAPEAYRAQLERANPIATESVTAGVWLVGTPEELAVP